MANWFDHEPTEEEWRGAPMTTHDPQLDEIMQRYVAMPDCGACEDGEHEDCSHPQGMVQVAVDELAPLCCCTDHPLVAVVADLVAEVELLRVAASIVEKLAPYITDTHTGRLLLTTAWLDDFTNTEIDWLAAKGTQ